MNYDVIRNRKEGQDDPKTQLICTLGSMLGHVHNLREGVVSSERAADRLTGDLNRIHNLVERLPDLKWSSFEDDMLEQTEIIRGM